MIKNTKGVVKKYKAYRFRLYPNHEQKILINKCFGCYRFIYNYYLNYIKENIDKEDTRIVKLEQFLQEIFNKLSISNLDNLDELTDELLEALKEVKSINEENDRLSKIYDGHFVFVKTYKDAIENYSHIDPKIIEKMLIIIYNDIKNLIETDVLTIQGKKNFIDNVKHNVTKIFLKEKIYSNIKNI